MKLSKYVAQPGYLSPAATCPATHAAGCQEDLYMQDDGSHGDQATQEFDKTVGVLQGSGCTDFITFLGVSPSLLYLFPYSSHALHHCIVVIADILLDPTFEQVQTVFCKKHCQSFEVTVVPQHTSFRSQNMQKPACPLACLPNCLLNSHVGARGEQTVLH